MEDFVNLSYSIISNFDSDFQDETNQATRIYQEPTTNQCYGRNDWGFGICF